MTAQKKLTISKASEVLKVSQATVRNWIKAGIISRNILSEEIILLKNNITDGKIQRLNKRANKLNSNKYFVPNEYAGNHDIIKSVDKIIAETKKYKKNVRAFLYNITISFLKEKGEISFSPSSPDKMLFKRKIYFKIINTFKKKEKINTDFLFSIQEDIKLLAQNSNKDILGLLYQSFVTEGHKSVAGSYYTPDSIIQSLINSLDDSIETFLDPCCGTGNFLLNAAKLKNLHICNIYGADIDENAVFITKINLLNEFLDYDAEPNIYCLDTLNELASGKKSCFTDFLAGKIDAIATNPPWGASKNKSPSLKYEKLLKSKEIYSMFIAKSIEIIRDGGECSFLLPESFLNIKTHSSIRQIICSQTNIISIREHGRVFTGVYTPVISIHFKKEQARPENKIHITKKAGSFYVNQSRFCKTYDYIFEINISPADINIIEKIYSQPHKKLKGNAGWVLGIVTGDNKKFIKSEMFDSAEPIYKGSDVCYFRLKKPSNFIKYDRNTLQQVAKKELFLYKEKLIYKFISDKLVFAYDNKQSLTLNSANILIPFIPGYTIKTTMAFLNSNVFQYIYKKKYSTHKVLKGNLEQLPFPVLSDKYKRILTNLVNKTIKREDNKHLIDKAICKIFKLNSEDVKIIEDGIK